MNAAAPSEFIIPAHIRLLIFDADGTLRRTTVAGQPCPHAPGEWELLPQVAETLARLPWQTGKLRLGIASNQDHVAYGWLSERTAYQLLEDLLREAGVDAAAVVRICPHAIEANCACRKPAPGLLLSLMKECAVTAAETLFVGDASTDREAARRAGVAFRWAWEFFDWNKFDCNKFDWNKEVTNDHAALDSACVK
jgi:histidinol-phosphate phosphatase family protein